LDAIEYYLQVDVQTYINSHPNVIKGPTNLSSYRDRFIRIRLKSIQILMSIVSVPFYYERLKQYLFEDYLEKSQDVQTTTVKTFAELRVKILTLLLAALQTEQDTNNAQLLFGLEFVEINEYLNVFSLGTIRLACSLAAHFEQTDENVKKGNDWI
jgi:hypothetical protein